MTTICCAGGAATMLTQPSESLSSCFRFFPPPLPAPFPPLPGSQSNAAKDCDCSAARRMAAAAAAAALVLASPVEPGGTDALAASGPS